MSLGGRFGDGVKEIASGVAGGQTVSLALAVIGIVASLVTGTLLNSPIPAAIIIGAVVLVFAGIPIYSLAILARRGDAYEVIESTMTWEILSTTGNQAVVTMVSKYRFLQDNIIAIRDWVKPATAKVKSYACSPGQMVDSFVNGPTRQYVISLRDSKSRNETETYTFRREMEDSFLDNHEWVSTEVKSRFGTLTQVVTLPAGRACKSAWARDTGSDKRQTLEVHSLSDGRLRFSRAVRRPKREREYFIEWEW